MRGSKSTLHQALKAFEKQEVKEMHTLTSPEDFWAIAKYFPFRDFGPSRFHGIDTHRIQRFILSENFSPREFDTLMSLISTEIEGNDFLECRTLWDELLDRPARYRIFKNDSDWKFGDCKEMLKEVEYNLRKFDFGSAEFIMQHLILSNHEFQLIRAYLKDEFDSRARECIDCDIFIIEPYNKMVQIIQNPKFQKQSKFNNNQERYKI
jgi:hypothetical protein